MPIPFFVASGSWFPLTMPPIHPILVNFTAALVPVSFGSDLLGRLFRRQTLAHAGWWSLVFAVLVTPLTAAAGWYWMRQMQDMDHAQMPIHKWLGIGIAIALPLVLWARWRTYRVEESPGWRYLSCTGLVVVALMLQGHLGGTMSFASDEGPTSGDATNNQHMEMHGGAMDSTHPGTGPTSSPATSPSATNRIEWKDHIDLP